eukprot:5160037-Amphidinium_carterae.1
MRTQIPLTINNGPKMKVAIVLPLLICVQIPRISYHHHTGTFLAADGQECTEHACGTDARMSSFGSCMEPSVLSMLITLQSILNCDAPTVTTQHSKPPRTRNGPADWQEQWIQTKRPVTHQMPPTPLSVTWRGSTTSKVLRATQNK